MGPNRFRRDTGMCVGASFVYPITSEMFELVVNRLYAYVEDSILFAVVRKPADRPTYQGLGYDSGVV